MINYIMILLAIIVGVVRICGVTHIIYKDIAHILIGMLLILAIKVKHIYIWLFSILCILEIVMALYTHL